MAEEKTGPNDGSNYYQEGDDDEKDEKEESLKKDEQYNKELEELEEKRKEMEERKKEQKKKFEKNKKDREELKEKEEITIGGQKVEPKKIYSHKKEEGIFVRGKSTNYSQKIDKTLRRKVHGVSLGKKKEIAEIIKNCSQRKTIITEKEIDNIFTGLKYKKYTDSGIRKMLKNKGKEGVDLNRYKKELKGKFSRRDIDKFRRALKGEEDPLKHKIKPNSNRNPGTGKSGLISPSARVGKRF
jgi:delta 1-pyrroline-5-carboxylate dehydrogenase